MHGLRGPMVPCERGAVSAERLVELAWSVDFKGYSMQHEVCLPEIRDVSVFLRAVLA